MKLEQLERVYERRRQEAQEIGATAPLAKVYARVLEELRALDGVAELDRWMDTSEAGAVLDVAPKTVANWCAEDRFSGARKTSGDTGEWRIPAREVYEMAGRPAAQEAAGVPKLWEPSSA